MTTLNGNELLAIVNDCLKEKIKQLKNDVQEIELTYQNLNNKLMTLNKFLHMVKMPKDMRQKNVFGCLNRVLNIMMEDYEKLSEYSEKKDIKKIKELNRMLQDTFYSNIFSSKKYFVLKKLINFYVKMYEENLKELNDYRLSLRKNINNYKNNMKIINNKTYLNNKDDYNIIIRFLKNISLDNDEYSNKMINQIDIEKSLYDLENEKRKSETSINNCIIKNQKEIKIEKKEEIKKDKFELLDSDDIDLIKIVKTLIFNKKDDLKYLEGEYAQFLRKTLSLSEKEISELNLIPTESIKKYKLDLLLFDINNLLNEIEQLNKNIKTKTNLNEKDKKELINKKDSIMNKINNKYLEYEKINPKIINKEENKEDNQFKKHLIFLTTDNGKPYFKSNIESKEITEEYYPSILNSLEEIEEGKMSTNPSKDGKYLSYLNKFYKKKGFKTRIVYIPYKDYSIVLYTFIKKSNNNSYILSKLKSMYKKALKQIDKLQIDLQDSSKREKIILENDKIYEEIKNHLTLKHKNKEKKKKIGN